ncbi:MAG: hypothetical protein EHM91_16790, partial [Planctomycetota bacterium]
MTRRVIYDKRRVAAFAAILCAGLLFCLAPRALFAQATAPASAPTSKLDEILKQEGYVAPPEALSSAVLAPRHLNVALSNLSPDKKWFLDEIGDGPVPM